MQHRRALSKGYDQINHEAFVTGAQLCDYYTCEIYPTNRGRFAQVIDRKVDYPAEFGYGLVTNKWLLETFSGRIGLIGADTEDEYYSEPNGSTTISGLSWS